MLIVALILPLLVLLISRIHVFMLTSQLTIPHGLWMWCVLVVVAPILEEIVFRGLVQDSMMYFLANARFSIKLFALAVLNVLFMLCHYMHNRNYQYLLLVFACGMIFSLVKIKYHRLYYPIILHVYYNLLFIAILL